MQKAKTVLTPLVLGGLGLLLAAASPARADRGVLDDRRGVLDHDWPSDRRYHFEGDTGGTRDRWRDPDPQPRRPRVYEGVEAERDRGAGRIVDPQNHELDRLRDRREGRREFESLDAERDRELRLERRDRQGRAGRDGRAGSGTGRVIAPEPDDVGAAPSPLASQLHEDEAAIAAAKKRLIVELNRIKAEEARVLEAARRRVQTPGDPDQWKRQQERIRLKYERRRDEAVEDYVKTRDRILGLPDLSLLSEPPEPRRRRAVPKAQPAPRESGDETPRPPAPAERRQPPRPEVDGNGARRDQ